MTTSTSTNSSTSKQRCTDAESIYHQSLVVLITEDLTLCALRGWTPADLRHELSAQVDPLMFRALPHIAESADADMYMHWIRNTRQGNTSHISVASLEKIRARIITLGSLNGWKLLSPIGNEEFEAKHLSTLNPEQRKAHHRIQALLKKAESTNFEAEAEALVFKAEALRQQYRIESALIGTYSSDDANTNNIITFRVHLRAPWVRYQFKLLAVVAGAHSCSSLLLTDSGIAALVGTIDDVTHVYDLFCSLNRQREHFMRSSAGAKNAELNGETSAYRRSFMIGFATQISKLLQRASEDALSGLKEFAPEGPRSVAPILLERALKVQSVLDNLFPNTRKMSFSGNNLNGIKDGLSAANRSHLRGDSSGLSGTRALPF